MGAGNKKKAYRWGHVAEWLGVIFLTLKGYSIQERRYKTSVGEIDIIARKQNITVFCEVKARKDYDAAAHSLSEKQKNRIRNAAEIYLSRLKNKNDNNNLKTEIIRCDMIMIIPWKWPIHIENAW
ncbi:YraN family protein [Pseudemcibacter aquimaris]|uniref:YraN family protein n=1 Tax=Pseudemcibacter aquimaris TaxID=2857064 RepID=UPI002011F3BC|nr:YraN family protein [Pseudemcibacter aquimaris]MCC3860332.1 YraN family protein [Pseudemcibacter aquimaris]WDU57657.1 YraN family protein [Pseudemcibacter aquimaris]